MRWRGDFRKTHLVHDPQEIFVVRWYLVLVVDDKTVLLLQQLESNASVLASPQILELAEVQVLHGFGIVRSGGGVLDDTVLEHTLEQLALGRRVVALECVGGREYLEIANIS